MAIIDLVGLLYDSLDLLKSRPLLQTALPAFLLHMGALRMSMTRKRVMHMFENRKRLALAFELHGLD